MIIPSNSTPGYDIVTGYVSMVESLPTKLGSKTTFRVWVLDAGAVELNYPNEAAALEAYKHLIEKLNIHD